MQQLQLLKKVFQMKVYDFARENNDNQDRFWHMSVNWQKC